MLCNTPRRWHPVKKPAWIAIREFHIDYLICTVLKDGNNPGDRSMSTLESIFWHIVGYAAMPAIFIFGFIAVAAGALWVLSLGPDKDS